MARKIYGHEEKIERVNPDGTVDIITKVHWTLEDHETGMAYAPRPRPEIVRFCSSDGHHIPVVFVPTRDIIHFESLDDATKIFIRSSDNDWSLHVDVPYGEEGEEKINFLGLILD